MILIKRLNNKKAMQTFSEKYRNLYLEMHKNANLFQGLQTLHFKNEIKKLCEIYNANSLLDYGCGKGIQYHEHKLHEYWNIKKLGLYDIGVPEYSEKPEEKFDIVISIDVLEHIEEQYVINAIKEIDQYALYAVLVNIATIPATKKLPDGQNAHATVKSKEWWTKIVKQNTEKTWIIYFRTELTRQNGLFEKFILNREKDDITFSKIKSF